MRVVVQSQCWVEKEKHVAYTMTGHFIEVFMLHMIYRWNHFVFPFNFIALIDIAIVTIFRWGC